MDISLLCPVAEISRQEIAFILHILQTVWLKRSKQVFNILHRRRPRGKIGNHCHPEMKYGAMVFNVKWTFLLCSIFICNNSIFQNKTCVRSFHLTRNACSYEKRKVNKTNISRPKSLFLTAHLILTVFYLVTLVKNLLLLIIKKLANLEEFQFCATLDSK